MKFTTAIQTWGASASVSLILALLPTTSFAAPIDGGSTLPVARGEVQARTCYLRAEQMWNRTMQQSPRNRQQLDASYRTFASCARLAIETGKVTRGGDRLPWLPEYFANTVGATYAQLQLATITNNPERCAHLKQAKDLAQQASQTEGEMATPGNPDFEQMWEALQHTVKAQSGGCNKMVFR